MKNSEKTMEKIVALCKGRGFPVLPSGPEAAARSTAAWPTLGITAPWAWS